MHIVFVTTELESGKEFVGGLGSFTSNLAHIFKKNNHSVSIILVTTKDYQCKLDYDIRLRHIYIELEKWHNFDKQAKELSKNNKEDIQENRLYLMNIFKGELVQKTIEEINSIERIDIIHYCNHGAFMRFASKEIPYVVRVSGLMNIWNGGGNIPYGSLEYDYNLDTIRTAYENNILKDIKNIISPSYLLQDIIQRKFGTNATVLETPFYLDLTKLDDNKYKCFLHNKKYILFFASRLMYLKGIHVVAGLVEEFLKDYPNCYLVVVGNSMSILNAQNRKINSEEMIYEAAREYSNRVLYLGSLSRQELYPIIQNAIACLLPSRIENLANSCIEVMALGSIPIATRGASYEQIIVDGENGFLSDLDNSESFMSAINIVMRLDTEKRNNILINAKKTIERFSPDNVYKQYFNYYNKVIDEWKYAE